jgi:hypothetical protein
MILNVQTKIISKKSLHRSSYIFVRLANGGIVCAKAANPEATAPV